MLCDIQYRHCEIGSRTVYLQNYSRLLIKEHMFFIYFHKRYLKLPPSLGLKWNNVLMFNRR